MNKKMALVREQILEAAGQCLLYNGWPCLTCINDAVCEGRLPQSFWVENFPEEKFNEQATCSCCQIDPWDNVYEFYGLLTEKFHMEGYTTQEDWRKIIQAGE